MSVSLYDASVGRFLQSLGAVSGYLDKGRSHCEENNIDLNEIGRDSPLSGYAAVSLSVDPGCKPLPGCGQRRRRQVNICRGQLRRILTTRPLQDLVAEAQSGCSKSPPRW